MKTRVYGLLCFALLLITCNSVWSQQAPEQTAPASVAGKWTLYCNDPNGTTSAKYLELNWWHNGSLPGSTSLMVRMPDGACWAALCNTRTEPHDEMDSALHTMMRDLASSLQG